MVKRGTAGSLSVDVYLRIRGEIFDGSLRPGERLQPAVLSAKYEASTTVVREALASLAGERLIRSSAGKGFFIPELDYDELQDTVLVRCHLETLALSLSMQRGGVEWESRVLAAHHRLSRAPRRLPEFPGRATPEWVEFHRAFHEELTGGCGIPILIDTCRQMTAATELYRIWAGPLPETASRDVAGEHAAIVDAVVAGDVQRATTLLAAHYQATADVIMAHAGSVDSSGSSTD